MNNEPDRIAELLEEAADRIAELEKEVKRLIGAEPITYGMLTFCKNCGEQNPYEPKVKQLSDEEIANIFAEHTRIGGTYDVKDIIFPFARAIIKEITE